MIEKPRISVNELAKFMVVSQTARLSIIRRARQPRDHVPAITRYHDVRDCLREYLADPKAETLERAEAMFARRAEDPGETSFRQDDAKQSIDVIHEMRALKDDLAPYQFSLAPSRQEKKLMVSGVEVSVRVDLHVQSPTKAGDQVGSAILRLTKDDKTTPAALDKRREMGLYTATLIMMHMSGVQNQSPTAKLCLSIDVQHRRAFAAPKSHKKRAEDLRSACITIAALWGYPGALVSPAGVPLPPDQLS